MRYGDVRFRVRHHYLKNPAYGWVFAFLRLSKPYLKFIPVSLPDEVAQPALPGGAALTGPTKPAGQIRRSRHPASCPTRGLTGPPEKINALCVPPSARRYARSPAPLSPFLPG